MNQELDAHDLATSGSCCLALDRQRINGNLRKMTTQWNHRKEVEAQRKMKERTIVGEKSLKRFLRVKIIFIILHKSVIAYY